MVEKVLVAKMKMIEAGIIPATNGVELSKMLESLSPEERRIAKRKFRKIWKKMAQKDSNLKDLMECKEGTHPNKHQKRNRSSIVFNKFVKGEI